MSARTGWLRAAVLGSNDAIVSIAGLMIGVAASSAPMKTILVTGFAGLAAGALSMAVGEYVSVSSQRDSEDADIERERKELAAEPEAELEELAGLYEKRGLDKPLARAVAEALTRHDQLEAHMRDELGINRATLAQPFQAAAVSALSFAVFAMLPIGALLVAPRGYGMHVIAAVSLVSLAVLGAVGGQLGGAPRLRAALRVTAGGALAMLLTAVIGRVLGLSVL